MDESTYRALGLDIRMDRKEPTSGMRNLNTGEELTFADTTGEDAQYQPAPECVEHAPGIPKGRLIEHLGWKGGSVYPDTTRDWWVYVPQQYYSSSPPPAAALLVCQDGALPGAERGTVCLDNLIAAGTIPVTIAVLVAPGSQTPEDGSQRSLEYDTVSKRYTDFLAEDLLPLVEAEFNITKDPGADVVCLVTLLSDRRLDVQRCSAALCDRRQLRGHLRVQLRLLPPGPVREGHLLDRLLHQHSGRPQLPLAGAKYPSEAHRGVPPGGDQRSI
jgi:hypothetical protein